MPEGTEGGPASPPDHDPGCRCRRCRERSDRELVNLVGSEQGDVAWGLLQERLTDYAYAVLSRWGRAGVLRDKADRRAVLGISRVPVGLNLEGQEARDLAIDIIEMALRDFRTSALPTWDPARGSSVKTYFVTWCLMKLPAAYERWYRREVAPLVGRAPVEEIARLADLDPGPEDLAWLRERIRELARNDRLIQRILLMRLEGYAYSQISKTLSDEGTHMSEKKVRGRLRDLGRRAYDFRESAE